MSDLDKSLETLYSGKCLPEKEVLKLCEKAKEYFAGVKNIVSVNQPVMIVGNTHGQLQDLFELMENVGKVPDTNFLFLGNYVDKGTSSVEVITLVLCLKLRYKERITLLRGNHESRQISKIYGFYDECFKKYSSKSVWKNFVEVFDYLPLVALVGERIFCVHSGLSPSIDNLDEIRKIKRFREIPLDGPMCDILWSDPEERQGWGVSPHGAGYTYGENISRQFLLENNLFLIARSHQIVMEGFAWSHKGNVVTVFSASNYCQAENKAAVMEVDDHLNCCITQFESPKKKNSKDILLENQKKKIPRFFITGDILS